MNRNELLRHLRAHGCSLLREGGSHSFWTNKDGKRAAIPRHATVKTTTARAICRQLEVPLAPGLG